MKKTITFITALGFMLVSIIGWGQTTVFSDDFSTEQSASWTTTGQIGASAISVSRSGADWGARRNTSPAQLELANDVGATTNVAGWVFAYASTAGFSSPYSTTLSSNSSTVTWYFNIRQIRTDPAGYGSGAYSAAFILATTSTTANNTGTGYAIVYGQSGSTDPIRLAKFSGGLSTGLTNIITSNTAGLADFGAEYISCKVTYNPSNNQWELFLRNDGASAFVDPTTGTLTTQGTAVDNTYTSTSLDYMGAYWQGSTGASQNAFFDNISVQVAGGIPTPAITASVTTLTGFTYIEGSGPSAEQSFNVSGSNLTANISVAAPTDYEVSTTSGSGFGAAVVLTQTGGTVSSTPVYVRLKAGLEENSYAGNVSITSTGATEKTVALSGSVTVIVDEPSNHPTNFTATANSTTALTLAWTDAVPAADGYLIKGSATSYESITAPVDGSATADATLVKNVAAAVGMHQFTGLTQNTTYYFKIFPYNGSGTSINYRTAATVPQTSATTQSETSTVTLTGTDPGTADFVVGSTNNVLYRIAVAVQFNAVTLNQLVVATSGTYQAADIPASGFKLWYSTTNSFGSDTQLAAVSSVSGNGENLTFTGLTQAFAPGTAYLFVTADIDAAATTTRTIGAAADADGDFTFAAALNYSGNAYGAANLHTIAEAPAVVALFISEYLEGSSNNKAIELVNKGVSTLDLSKVTVKLYSNGSSSAGNTLLGLSGSLGPGEVYLIVNASANAAIKAYSDVESTVTFFNGDDAIEVLYDGVTTDVFGQIGNDPGTGWSVGGVANMTPDKTLIRKLTINQGNTTNLGSFGTNADNAEWIIKDMDYSANLGEYGTAFTVATNTDWATASNWDMGLPSASYSAIVASTANHPVAASASSMKNLLIKSGSNLQITGQLTVSGSLTNSAGSTGLVIKSDATGTGSLIHNTADVPATVERYITGNSDLTAFDYHLVSVPLDAAVTNAQFLGSYLYHFDAATQAWTSNGTSTTGPVPVDAGYMVYYPNASTTYNFVGELNNGSFTAATGLDAADEFALVPNPYPSAIDWDAASGWTKTNLRNAIYVWDPVGNQYAAYGAEAGINGGTRYIPAGQAFFVKSSAASTVLSMNNSVRVHNTQAFWKEGEVTKDLLRVKALGNGLSDELVLRFGPGVETGLDAKDVDKLFGSDEAPQIYTLTADERQLSINTQPYSQQTVVVPMGFELKKDGEVNLNFSGIEAFEPTVNIFLEDSFTGEMINLRENPVYTFSHTLGSEAIRFKLHLMGVTAVGETPSALAGGIWSDGNALYLSFPELQGQKALYELFDLSGRLLESRSLSLGAAQRVQPQASGVVIARVSIANQVYINKLFIR